MQYNFANTSPSSQNSTDQYTFEATTASATEATPAPSKRAGRPVPFVVEWCHEGSARGRHGGCIVRGAAWRRGDPGYYCRVHRRIHKALSRRADHHSWNESMAVTMSADGQGTVVLGKASCTKIGELIRCLPYDATLFQNGAKLHIPLASGTVWLNPSQAYQPMSHSSTSIPPRGVVLAVRANAARHRAHDDGNGRRGASMKSRSTAAIVLVLAFVLVPTLGIARGGFARPAGGSARPSGGFDLHG